MRASTGAPADCVFCRIVGGDIPAQVVLRTDTVTAFRDLDPQAPTHVLVIPNVHVADLREADAALVAALLEACNEVARSEGVADTGYRVVANTGRHGGQSVFHLHLHVLGGRPMRWPPG
jgi:histidine triad (HIT) family protein